MRQERYMRAALKSAQGGMRRGEGGPFGACIVRKGKIIARAHNTVLLKQDPTCHAEINAIRLASRKCKNFDLSDCEIYSTTEPCPMCFSAIHWAKIKKIYYGTSIQDVHLRGFNELTVSAAKMKRLGSSPVVIKPARLKKECLELLKDWDRLENRLLY